MKPLFVCNVERQNLRKVLGDNPAHSQSHLFGLISGSHGYDCSSWVGALQQFPICRIGQGLIAGGGESIEKRDGVHTHERNRPSPTGTTGAWPRPERCRPFNPHTFHFDRRSGEILHCVLPMEGFSPMLWGWHYHNIRRKDHVLTLQASMLAKNTTALSTCP